MKLALSRVILALSLSATSLVFLNSCALEDFFADLETGFSPTSSSRYGTAKKPEPAKPKPKPPYTLYNSVYAKATTTNTRFVIDIAKQRGYLLVNGEIGMSTPVSTARSGKYTPRGTFYVSERIRSGKISTIYKSEMPFWMRLSGSVFGVHAGHLPGYPASAGCIRLPWSAAQIVYDKTKHGTKVSIYSSWSGAS